MLDANSFESGLNGQARRAPGAPSTARCRGKISFDPADHLTFPKTVILDFETGCTDPNGPARKGIIKIVVSKLFFETGATATITFENYSVNGIKVEGTQKLTNLSGTTGRGYNYTVTGGKLTFPNGAVYLYEGTRTLTQTEGANTIFDIGDDTYQLTGNATLKDSASTATAKIDQPLVRKISCAYVSKGILSVAVNGHTAKIDYGNGDCDNKAMLTLGDKSKEITLSK